MTPCATNIDRIIGANIKARRKEAGLTQAVLAERIDLSFQQLQKYERGKNRVSVSRLLQIATALGVPPETLWQEDAADGPRQPKTLR